MLHIVRHSPFESPSLKHCLAAFLCDDVLLLIENGVFCALRGVESSELMTLLAGEEKVFVLMEDVLTRGISERLIDNLQHINFDGFVDLTIAHYPIMHW